MQARVAFGLFRSRCHNTNFPKNLARMGPLTLGGNTTLFWGERKLIWTDASLYYDEGERTKTNNFV